MRDARRADYGFMCDARRSDSGSRHYSHRAGDGKPPITSTRRDYPYESYSIARNQHPQQAHSAHSSQVSSHKQSGTRWVESGRRLPAPQAPIPKETHTSGLKDRGHENTPEKWYSNLKSMTEDMGTGDHPREIWVVQTLPHLSKEQSQRKQFKKLEKNSAK